MHSTPLGFDERLPLYQRLRDALLERISAGEWLPDQSIPTEQELSNRYNVAVGTVRKAVDALVGEGLLQRVQGRGTYVRRPDFGGSLFRFFRQVSASGEVRVPQSQILARSLETPPTAARQALGLGEEERCIRLERLRLLDGKPLFHEQIWLPHTRFAALLDVDPEDFGNLLYPFYEAHCEQRIASARETLTVETASAEVAAALGVDASSPVVVIERIARGYDRSPLEYRLSRGGAATFRYQVEIS